MKGNMMKNNLATLRKQTQLTQEQLAKIVGCRRETITKLEKGKYNPSLKLCYKILNAINDHPNTRIQFYLEDVFPDEVKDSE